MVSDESSSPEGGSGREFSAPLERTQREVWSQSPVQPATKGTAHTDPGVLTTPAAILHRLMTIRWHAATAAQP